MPHARSALASSRGIRLVVCFALVASVAAPVAGQQTGPPRTPEPLPGDSAAGQDTVVATASIEPLRLAGSLVLGAGIGRLAYGAFQTQAVEASKLNDQGTATEKRGFARDIRARTSVGPVVSLTAWITETWGFRLEAALARPVLEAAYSGKGTEFLDAAGGVKEPSDGRLSHSEAAAAVLFRPPVHHPFYTPYAIFGAGVQRYRGGDGVLPAGADSAFATGVKSALSGLFGLGAYVPIRGSLLLQIEAVRRITPTPIASQSTGVVWESDSLRVAFLEPGSGDTTIDTTGGWRLTVGLSYLLRLGRREEGVGQEPTDSISSNLDEVRSVSRTRSRTTISMR